MPGEELPIQKFHRAVREFSDRRINREQFLERLPPAIAGMQSIELDAALTAVFENKNYSDVHPDVARIVAEHSGPELANTIAALFESTSSSTASVSFAKALVKYGEPSMPLLMKTLQQPGEEPGVFDRKLTVVRTLSEARLSVFSKDSQSALLKELTRIAFDKDKENDVIRIQAVESLRDLAESKEGIHPAVAADALSELTKAMPTTEEEHEKQFGSDKTMPNYFVHTLSSLAGTATASVKKLKGAEQEEAAEKIEDALHKMVAQEPYLSLVQTGLRRLGDLGRANPRTLDALFEPQPPLLKGIADEALTKLAPEAGKTPYLVNRVAKKFIASIETEPLRSFSYGRFLANAGSQGIAELQELMKSHPDEEVRHQAARCMADSFDGTRNLISIVTSKEEPQLRASALLGLGAFRPPTFAAQKAIDAHLKLINRVAADPKEPLEVRQAAMHGLLSTGEKGVAKVRAMLDDAPTPQGKLNIARFLTLTGAGLDVLADVLEKHPDVMTRAAAAMAVETSPTILGLILPKERRTRVTGRKGETIEALKVVEHPLYTVLKKKAFLEPKEDEMVKRSAELALKRIRALRERPTYAPFFAKTESMLPPEPTPEGRPGTPTPEESRRERQLRRAAMLPTMVGAQAPRVPTERRTTQKKRK